MGGSAEGPTKRTSDSMTAHQFQTDPRAKRSEARPDRKSLLRVVSKSGAGEFLRGEKPARVGSRARACGGELPQKGELGETLRQYPACARTCIEAFLAQH
jgi:hypothetical protein